MRFQAQYSKNIADLQQGNEYSYSELSSCQKEESAINFLPVPEPHGVA